MYNILPAMLAVIKHIIEPDTKALPTTDVTDDLLFGAIVQSIAIIIPTEQGFAKPHIAKVVMAELRAFKIKFFFSLKSLLRTKRA